MLALFVLLISVFASVSLGATVLSLLKAELDPAEKLGMSGLIGLGFLGTGIYFSSLLHLPLMVSVGVMAVAIAVVAFKSKPSVSLKVSLPKGGGMLGVFAIVLLALMPLVGVLTPSTALDWDSLAYHLALPKLWEKQGYISSVSFIHHSNFPGVVDAWFFVGQMLGGQSSAKAFTWLFTIFGTFAIFGYLRSRFTSTAGWLGAIAFLSIPLVMWESGTAYIDVANGLYAGFGFLFAAQFIERREKSDIIVAAIMLALAAGSKYTGLQSILIASFLVLVFCDDRLSGVILGGMAGVLAFPWYLKNWILEGNPVYPFFYSVFGGKNWGKFESEIYSREQGTFGYHGSDNLGQSIFGLVTSPGRFTNPAPTAGLGFAFASIGFAVMVGAVIGVVRGLASKLDRSLALMILLQLLAWFALSQQSRYILALVVPLLYFLARGFEWKPLGKVVAAAVAIQALATIWIYKETIVAERLPVLVGGLTKDEFLGGYKLDNGTPVPGAVDFYAPAQAINADNSITKIGLFDEVFGYYLDKPYFWATPGHTTEMGYTEMRTVDEFVAALKKLGISHIYIFNKYIAKADEEMWLKATGVEGPVEAYPPNEREARMADPGAKWRVLSAEAIASKRITLVTRFSRMKFLFKVE